jgi:hypothetical protein
MFFFSALGPCVTQLQIDIHFAENVDEMVQLEAENRLVDQQLSDLIIQDCEDSMRSHLDEAQQQKEAERRLLAEEYENEATALEVEVVVDAPMHEARLNRRSGEHVELHITEEEEG